VNFLILVVDDEPDVEALFFPQFPKLSGAMLPEICHDRPRLTRTLPPVADRARASPLPSCLATLHERLSNAVSIGSRRLPKQKDRRQAVLSLTVGVDTLDFALALDNGHYGSLMSLVGASRCENLSIKPNLKAGQGSRKIK
jgi:hypothetical protein